jgi:hypothetical protein
MLHGATAPLLDGQLPLKVTEWSKNPYFCGLFVGVLSGQCLTAEKIPVEPEQGNACAGKVVNVIYSSSLSQHFSQTNFDRHLPDK